MLVNQKSKALTLRIIKFIMVLIVTKTLDLDFQYEVINMKPIKSQILVCMIYTPIYDDIIL